LPKCLSTAGLAQTHCCRADSTALVQQPPSREKPPIDGLRSRKQMDGLDLRPPAQGRADDGLAYAGCRVAVESGHSGDAARFRSARAERVPRRNAGDQGPNSARRSVMWQMRTAETRQRPTALMLANAAGRGEQDGGSGADSKAEGAGERSRGTGPSRFEHVTNVAGIRVRSARVLGFGGAPFATPHGTEGWRPRARARTVLVTVFEKRDIKPTSVRLTTSADLPLRVPFGDEWRCCARVVQPQSGESSCRVIAVPLAVLLCLRRPLPRVLLVG
jgi:hypothetical protein